LFQSVVLGWRPYLNVDVANKVFPRPLSLLDWKGQCNLNNEWERRKLEESLIGVRLVYTPPDAPANKRTYTSQGLARSATQEYLTDDNGQRLMTVAQYFAQKNYRLRHPELPCIRTGRPGSAVLPMEFCRVAAAQANNKQAPDDCKQEMIKKTAVSTAERQSKILELVGDANYVHPVIKQFGLSVDDKFAQTDARILDEPSLEYAGSKSVKPKSGVWQLRANEQFNTAKTISKWSVICLARVDHSVIQTFGQLVSWSFRTLS
jgi:eukaryotic translation initiation factor 2C